MSVAPSRKYFLSFGLSPFSMKSHFSQIQEARFFFFLPFFVFFLGGGGGSGGGGVRRLGCNGAILDSVRFDALR